MRSKTISACLWEVELTYRYIFTFKFTLRSQQPDIVSIICRRCRWHEWQYRWQIVAGIVDTGGKFATSINNTSENGGKIRRWCRWYRWCTMTCEYLREFSKKFETVLMGYSGAGGKLIHEILKQKISWHCPFKSPTQIGFEGVRYSGAEIFMLGPL